MSYTQYRQYNLVGLIQTQVNYYGGPEPLDARSNPSKKKCCQKLCFPTKMQTTHTAKSRCVKEGGTGGLQQQGWKESGKKNGIA